MKKIIVIVVSLLFFSCSDSSKDYIGVYYWDGGMGTEIKVHINEDGTWKKDIYENGILQKDEYGVRSGKYIVLNKEIKKADGNYFVQVISFDGGETGYLFSKGCFNALTDDVVLQTNMWSGESPFPGILNCSYCKE